MSRSSFRSRRAVEIYVDVGLLVSLLLLFSPRLTGLPVHEWLGIALGIPLVVHLVLSWSWIRTTSARIPSGTGVRARVNYFLNWLLFVLIVLEVTSGVGISQAALPQVGISTINDRTWRALHNQALNLTLLLIGLHIAMNWGPFARGISRYLRPGPNLRE